MEGISCPLCGENSEQFLWTKKGARYVQCVNCSLVYENPRLDEMELKKFYSDESYYVNKTSETDPSGYTDYFSQCTPAIVNEYFDILNRSSEKTTDVHFLDIGCGPGRLLKAAKDHGWKAVGLEISRWSVEIGRRVGLEIVEGVIQDAAFPDKSFDIISMFDVLEHLPFPREYVLEVYRILKPQGIVVVETPNISGFFARHWYRERSDLVKPHAHISLYSPDTVKRLFRTAPFSNIKVHTFPYCRHYTLGYFKSLTLSRLRRNSIPTQFTYNESLRITAQK